MKETPQEIYRQRLEKFGAEAKDYKSRSISLSWFRVISFVIFIVGFVYMANLGISSGLLYITVIFISLYIFLLKKHEKVKSKLRVLECLAQINSDEILRSNFNLRDFDDGAEFYDGNHPYHIDLDVFGKHSLFQLINRSSSLFGRKILASWLSTHAKKADILTRQQAVEELKSQIDLRQSFQAFGLSEGQTDQRNAQDLFEWLRSQTKVNNKGLYTVLLIVMPILSIGSIVLASLGYVQTGLPILITFINVGILGTLFNKLLEITRQTENGYKSLRSLKEQIVLIENHEFEGEFLKELKSRLSPENEKASQILKELSIILDNLQNRVNLLYFVFNVTLMLDIYWYLKISKWKQKNEANLEEWFEVIGQIDTLMSIGGYAYANPEYSYAIISDNPHTIKAQELGHPLINSVKRVSNDFDFSGRGGICLITGSNMSGKSTFLRTVGINSLLALMGAPVCAKNLEVGELKVFTSMRTQDDLEESVSSFYAELKRLKQLIGQIDDARPTLFMIDEVLKGTNSEDRHKGAIALIRQLNKANAFGFVSTHDIVLGNITNELEGVKNYSFNSTISGDEIHFDYTLTPGLCKGFNATKLMQLMGIEVEQ